MNAEHAFIPTPDDEEFFASGPASMVLAQLQRGLDDASPVIVVTGEPGVGKTTVVRQAIARWGERVHAVWFEVDIGPADKTLLKTIRAFGGHGRAKDGRPELIARMVYALNEVTARGQLPVLVVDDAHVLDPEMLAEVGRMESAAIAADLNLKLLLVGEHKLNEMLEREDLEFISQRLAMSCRLDPMEQADARQYLAHRVSLPGGDASNVFSRKAAREIHAATRGVPAAINALAADAQRRADTTNAGVVTPEHVRAAMASTQRTAPTIGTRAPSGATSTPSVVSRPASPAPTPPPTLKLVPPARSAAPTDPLYPRGGPRQAQPVPPRVKRVPPPPPQSIAPPDPTVDLDSAHPRVKEWVSRFTDGQPLRIGGATPLPITDPSEIPGLEQPSIEQAPAFEAAPPSIAAQPPAPAPTASTPAPSASPIASVPSPSPTPPPPPPQIDPNPVVLAPTTPQLVTPEQLAPPPLVLNEQPASATPKSGTFQKPASPVAQQGKSSPSGSMPKPSVASSPALPPLTKKALPSESVLKPPAPHAKPTPSGQMQRPAAQQLKPSPSTQVQRPAATTPAAKPSPSSASLGPAVSPPKPSPSASFQRPVAAPTPPPAPVEPPLVLTSKDVKAHRPTKAERRRQEAEQRQKEAEARRQQEAEQRRQDKAIAAASAAAAAATTAYAAPRASAPPSPPAAQRLVTTTLAEELDPRTVELGRATDVDNTPQIYRILGALIPILLILGMAATAVVLSRRAAFDRGPVPTDTETATETTPTTDTDPAAIPVAPPVTPPLVVTPETDDVVAPEPVAEPRFCLSVGTYLFSDRARMRTVQLSRRTHMNSWVVTTTSDGSYTYRVMLGGFATLKEAERVADKLLSRGVVEEALVQPMPKNN